MNEKLLTIREMFDAYNVTPRTLRFYESKELLFPVREGQKRLFTRRDRARLKLILHGKRFGFSLEELRQLLDLYDIEHGKALQVERTLEIAKLRLADFEQRREELEETIADLTEQINWGEELLSSLDRSEAAE